MTIILFLIFRLTGFADTINPRNIGNSEIQPNDTLENDYYKSLIDSFLLEDYIEKNKN